MCNLKIFKFKIYFKIIFIYFLKFPKIHWNLYLNMRQIFPLNLTVVTQELIPVTKTSISAIH